MEKEPTTGRMARSMRENGCRERSKDLASGKGLKANPTWASGKTTKPQAMVFTFGRMETSTRVNGCMH